MRKLSDLSAMRKSNARYIFCIYIRSRLYPKYYTEEIIQMKYELTQDLLTGNALIDSEHRQLFTAVSSLMDACSQGQGRAQVQQTITFLSNYVVKHFGDEERLQVQSSYPGYAAHKQFHEGYRRQLAEVSQELMQAGPTVKALGDLNRIVAVLVSARGKFPFPLGRESRGGIERVEM